MAATPELLARRAAARRKILRLLRRVLATTVLAGIFWGINLNLVPDVSVPTPKMPAVNALDSYAAASKALVNPETIRNASKAPPKLGPNPWNGSSYGSDVAKRPYSLAEKERLLRSNARALQLFRAALTCPYRSPPFRSFRARTPLFRQYPYLVSLLVLDAQAKSARGQWNDATQATLDLMQFSAAITQGAGTGLWEFSVSDCQSQWRRLFWKQIPHLTGPQALAAIQRIEMIQATQATFAEALQEQKWSDQAGLMEVFRNPFWRVSPRALAEISHEFDIDQDWTWPQLLLVYAFSNRRIMAQHTRYMNEEIRNARTPYAVKPPIPPVPIDPYDILLFPETTCLCDAELSGFERMRCAETQGKTQIAFLRVALALQAYCWEKKTYPSSLSALVSKYLNAVPDDPFAFSGPLHYRKINSRYLLYSVGPDGKDDGGKPLTLADASAAGSRSPWNNGQVGDMVSPRLSF